MESVSGACPAHCGLPGGTVALAQSLPRCVPSLSAPLLRAAMATNTAAVQRATSEGEVPPPKKGQHGHATAAALGAITLLPRVFRMQALTFCEVHSAHGTHVVCQACVHAYVCKY
jgi:hypothetical protein